MSAHEHESWQLQDSPGGGRYCAACGEKADDTTPEPYTPTDKTILGWVTVGALRMGEKDGDLMWDAWLADHDARVRAEAWDAAVVESCSAACGCLRARHVTNPYRTEQNDGR